MITPTTPNIEIALALRERFVKSGAGIFGDDLLAEVIRRFERLAMATGECEVLMVHQSRVSFSKPSPVSVLVRPPHILETPEIRDVYVPRGEHIAVDLWGRRLILHYPEDPRR